MTDFENAAPARPGAEDAGDATKRDMTPEGLLAEGRLHHALCGCDDDDHNMWKELQALTDSGVSLVNTEELEEMRAKAKALDLLWDHKLFPPHPGCGNPHCFLDHEWMPGTSVLIAANVIIHRLAPTKEEGK